MRDPVAAHREDQSVLSPWGGAADHQVRRSAPLFMALPGSTGIARAGSPARRAVCFTTAALGARSPIDGSSGSFIRVVGREAASAKILSNWRVVAGQSGRNALPQWRSNAPEPPMGGSRCSPVRPWPSRICRRGNSPDVSRVLPNQDPLAVSVELPAWGLVSPVRLTVGRAALNQGPG